jgi:hypothetical protein
MPRRPHIPPIPPTPEPTGPLFDWDIFQVRHTPARLIGWVQARNADEAVREAAKQFNRDAKRLIAVRRR